MTWSSWSSKLHLLSAGVQSGRAFVHAISVHWEVVYQMSYIPSSDVFLLSFISMIADFINDAYLYLIKFYFFETGSPTAWTELELLILLPLPHSILSALDLGSNGCSRVAYGQLSNQNKDRCSNI